MALWRSFDYCTSSLCLNVMSREGYIEVQLHYNGVEGGGGGAYRLLTKKSE